MTSWSEARLQDPGYRRYVLAGLALDWMCIQLEPYLLHEIEGLHRDLLANGHTRPWCHSNSNTYKDVKSCPQRSCGASVRFLESYHINGSVRMGWRNSDIELWQSHPWAIALLFMNQGQDPSTNTCPAQSDISGILNLLLFCTRFGVNKRVVEQIRDRRNALAHHSSTFTVSQLDFTSLLDDIENLLSDPCVDPHLSNNASEYLDQMRKMKFDITFGDEVKVLSAEINFTKHEYRRLHGTIVEEIDAIKNQMVGQDHTNKHLLEEFQQMSASVVQIKDILHDPDNLKHGAQKISVAQSDYISSPHDERSTLIELGHPDSMYQKIIEPNYMYLSENIRAEDHLDYLCSKSALTLDEKQNIEKESKGVCKLLDILKFKSPYVHQAFLDSLHENCIQVWEKLLKTPINAELELNAIDQDGKDVSSIQSHLKYSSDEITIHSREKKANEEIVQTLQTYAEHITTLQDEMQQIVNTFQEHADVEENVDQKMRSVSMFVNKVRNNELHIKELEEVTGPLNDKLNKVETTQKQQTDQIMCLTQDMQEVKIRLLGQDETNQLHANLIKDLATKQTTTDLQPKQLREKLFEVYKDLSKKESKSSLNVENQKFFTETIFQESVEKPAHKYSRRTVQRVSSDIIPDPADKRRILINGFAGSGKSTICKHWRKEFVMGSKSHNLSKYSFVILLRVNSLKISLYESIKDMIFGKIQTHYEAQDVQKSMTGKTSLIILDGYDEADKPQQKIVEDIFNDELQFNLIVTSRPNRCKLNFERHLENVGFNIPQQETFFDNFKKSIDAKHVEHYNMFLEQVKGNRIAHILFTGPLVAFLTATMVKTGRNVKLNSRIGIYKQLVEFLENCEEINKEVNEESVKKSMPFIRKAIFLLLTKQNKYHMTRNFIQEHLENIENIEDILLHLSIFSKCGFQEDDEVSYSCAHKSIAEYLSAQYITSLDSLKMTEELENLISSGNDNLEIVRFAIGHIMQEEENNICKLLRALCRISLNEDHTKLEETIIIGGTKCVVALWLLMLFVDIDPNKLSQKVLDDLALFCIQVNNAKEFGRDQDISKSEKPIAAAIYNTILLKAHQNSGSLDKIKQIDVEYADESICQLATSLPSTLCDCMSVMSSLTKLHIYGIYNETHLNQLCGKLHDNGGHHLQDMCFGASRTSDISTKPMKDTSKIAQILKNFRCLKHFELQYLNVGGKDQLGPLVTNLQTETCLETLKLLCCSISSDCCKQNMLKKLCELGRRTTLGTFELRRQHVDGDHAEWSRIKADLKFSNIESVTISCEDEV